MKSAADILRNAAERIESGDADRVCYAITNAGKPRERARAVRAFWGMYFDRDSYGDHETNPHAPRIMSFWGDDRDARIVGACLAAAVLDRGDDAAPFVKLGHDYY